MRGLGRGSRGRGDVRVGGGGGGGRGRGRGRFRGVGRGWKDAGVGTDMQRPNDDSSVRRVGRSRVWRSSEDALESSFGFHIFSEGEPRLGWLLNMASSSLEDQDNDNVTFSCVNLYFMCQDGSTFKAQVKFAPYFYIGTKENTELEVDAYLRRRYEGQIANIQVVSKEDLGLKNHLSGLQHSYLKVSFNTVQELMNVKSELLPIVDRNQAKLDAAQAYESLLQGMTSTKQATGKIQDYVDFILEMREYDVPYHVRFAIDNDIRCGLWYMVSMEASQTRLERRTDLLQRAEVRVCAFDIETTKLPLKFPDASYDSVMMISYMIDGQGYLIINRECVGQDIEDLEYTPKPEFEGYFKVTNVTQEKELLVSWFSHMREVKPGIYVTYNGDFFDWPFIEQRALHHGMRMHDEIGFRCDAQQGECLSRFACHLDCFAWVKRDSYLPQGSQGLKAVTKAKLGYDPLEVNPEDMVRKAVEEPQTMASYSVSDAVSTYYLYMTYVHPFIFSLATIIPMRPDEVLRKGSGTLCEMLLTVQAYKGNIICPNKYKSEQDKVYNGRVLESETYIGGHVECLESGVFRSDLPTRFRLVPEAYQQLIDHLDRDLHYAIVEEGKMGLDSVTNYDDVKEEIKHKLEILRDGPNREEKPVIYHLDVAAMYPNIILTNRLQPPSIVTDDVCAACDFNRPGKTCLRQMEWVWRGETYSAKRRGSGSDDSEYNHLKNQIESEQFHPSSEGGLPRFFRDLPKDEQQAKLKDRLKKYCQKVYKRVLDKPITDIRTASICMRENPFYVDTVRSFRDRRYEYKGLNKVWKGKLSDAKASGNPIKVQEAQDMVVLYDSLQLAHKCILNSFYGYVMRKGARWYSMEMAGVVTYTGAKIIQNARILVEQIGKPLELDTDGIWCALPASFPENFTFKTKDVKKKITISYPCVMLNVDVALKNTNDQYQTLVDNLQRTYETTSECSIEFEVDGPYKAMILPASKEEGVLLKKRYAVFNDDGTLAELKGFEIKRRGELKLIKVFQAEVFENFLQGETLEECYAAVAAVADRWLDLLENQGIDIADGELLDYISESSTMSKSLEDYGERKSCATTTARRLADFLGDEMVKDKGLSCRYVVARDPQGAPVSERAIPVAIFETDPGTSVITTSETITYCNGIFTVRIWIIYFVLKRLESVQHVQGNLQDAQNQIKEKLMPGKWVHRRHTNKTSVSCAPQKADVMRTFVRKWCKCSADVAVRSIVDWGYYRQRLSSAIQKIITIPAAMQKVVNPVPRVPHPEWLWKKIREKDDKYQQRSLKDMFGPKVLPVHNQHLESELAGDVEDMVGIKVNSLGGGPRPMIHTFDTNKEVRFPISPNSESGMANQPQPQKTTKARTPDRNADYSAWLEHKKRKWKEIRENRKRSRQNFEQDSGGHQEGTSGTFLSRKVGRQAQAGLGAFFRNQEAALTHSHWQILHLAPSSQRPGEFSAWVLSDGNMYKVPVQVPRVFYLNTRAPNTEEYPGARVNRVLPHGRQSFNLIEVVIDEKQFKDAGRMLAAHLADPEVEGVYETKLPLALHALLQLGCVCMVDPKARNRTIKQGWSLNDLRMKTTTECPYLINNLSFFFLYHSSMDNRGIYALYMPAATKALVVVVNPFNNREIAAAQLERQFQNAVRSQDQPKADNSEVSCKVEYAVNNADAGRLLQRTLNEYRDQYRGPTIAVVECPSLNSTIATVPVLSDFPCVEIACNARDSQYQALGWQPLAGRVAMQRCAASAFWLHERITLSRYAHVPLGNFNSDWLLFTADTFFARALRDHSQVLWVSSDGLPDLGGIPEDEPCFADEVQQPALTYSGAYRSISIELKVHHLAVNALLKSSQVNEMEGGALLGFSSDVQDAAGAVGVQTSWDETVSCAPAFQVLKHMVQGWLSDAVSSGNVFADCLLQHLYRWLCSPLSKLHDPALHRILHKVMQKVYALLLAELRKLGATIVFADFSRIIIATGKFQVPAAQGYCEYLLKTIKTRELFEWIDLEPKIYWHSLLFMDQYNYGGVQAKDIPPLDAAETADSSQDATQNGSTEIVSNWNIAEYLPKVTLDYFLVIVSEFVYIPWKHSQEQAIQRAEALAAGSNFCTPSVTVSAASDIEAQETAYLKHQIASYFTDKLLRIVRDLQKHMLSRRIDVDDPELQLAREFPKLAGSHLVMGDVALEFIKHVCAVLALDNRVQHNVLIMRKNLLKLVHVREFSAEAEFKDPCLSFTLPNVICSYCNDRRDLDLCRDAALLEHDWRCVIPQCGQPYDRSWIENTLLQIVRQRERLFHLQDLVCSKCCQVKASHLAEQCSCAGAFKCTDNATDFLERMRVFLNIAIYHGFNLLQEVVSWVLELSLPTSS